MVDVLEDMGFPTEWCERALKSASGLETAVELLLQWQAHGVPQFVSQQTSAPPFSTSAGKNVLQPANSRSQPSGGPTLKLLPIPANASKAVVIEGEQSPSSILHPSTSSGPSGLDSPPGLRHRSISESPSSSIARDARSQPLLRLDPQNRQTEQSPSDRLAGTESSRVEGGTTTVERGAPSRVVHNSDCSDAVVPDVYAEERKARYQAARRLKQEKEQEKARIRQQMQEDMALRRFRHTYQNLPVETERLKSPSSADHGDRFAGFSGSRPVAMDAAVELQIRCPGNQVMKASFTAGAKLKDVRAYVEHQLQQPRAILALHDINSRPRSGSVPFSGASACLSSDREIEREILQQARENFELQTSRILESAKNLRNNASISGNSNSQSAGIMYFLIPFPRQEFFTESSMESTLAEAQLVPRGTLVVHRCQPDEIEQPRSVPAEPEACCTNAVEQNMDDDVAPVVFGSSGFEAGPEEAVEHQVAQFPILHPSMTDTITCGRTLEMEGERGRVRELALQAAAKRMSEAAKIFRAGLPLEEGETGEAFDFPMDRENHEIANEALAPKHTTFPQVAIPGPDNQSLNGQTSGAHAKQVTLPGTSHDQHTGSSGPRKWPLDSPVDSRRLQAKAAAEARMRSQEPCLVSGSSCNQEPDEAESRICEEPESRPTRGRARIPQSSRLLSRPEKLQRTTDMSPSSNSPDAQDVGSCAEQKEAGESSSQAPMHLDAESRARPLEAALQRYNTVIGADKGKRIAEESVQPEAEMPCSSVQADFERNSSLRVRLEDGSVVLHTFPANTALQSVRDSVVLEGAVASDYGFVVPFPEPHFVEGEALSATLEEVGLVPRGTIHLTKLATRGMVRQGGRYTRHRRHMEDDDDADEVDHIEGLFRHFAEHMTNPHDLSYEALLDMGESLGRVHVGVPEERISSFSTHVVKAAKSGTSSKDAAGGEVELDLCIVCMADIVGGEEALSLPCFHIFHPLCIRQWLLQSTCCPTCKQSLV